MASAREEKYHDRRDRRAHTSPPPVRYWDALDWSWDGRQMRVWGDEKCRHIHMSDDESFNLLPVDEP